MVVQTIWCVKPSDKLVPDETSARPLVLGNLGSGACSIQNVFGQECTSPTRKNLLLTLRLLQGRRPPSRKAPGSRVGQGAGWTRGNPVCGSQRGTRDTKARGAVCRRKWRAEAEDAREA